MISKMIKALFVLTMVAEGELQVRSDPREMRVNAGVKHDMLEKQAELFAEQLEAMQTDPKSQAQLKLLTEEIEEAMADPKVKKQAEIMVKQMEAIMADPSAQEQAKQVVEEMEA